MSKDLANHRQVSGASSARMASNSNSSLTTQRTSASSGLHPSSKSNINPNQKPRTYRHSLSQTHGHTTSRRSTLNTGSVGSHQHLVNQRSSQISQHSQHSQHRHRPSSNYNVNTINSDNSSFFDFLANIRWTNSTICIAFLLGWLCLILIFLIILLINARSISRGDEPFIPQFYESPSQPNYVDVKIDPININENNEERNRIPRWKNPIQPWDVLPRPPKGRMYTLFV